MIRKILSSLIVVSALGLVSCSAPADDDYETLREKCKNKPSLPECQDEDVPEDNPSMGDED
jgi:hypothetical protein